MDSNIPINSEATQAEELTAQGPFVETESDAEISDALKAIVDIVLVAAIRDPEHQSPFDAAEDILLELPLKRPSRGHSHDPILFVMAHAYLEGLIGEVRVAMQTLPVAALRNNIAKQLHDLGLG